MGSIIWIAEFPSVAIASSCFTARCASIWYGFFIATLSYVIHGGAYVLFSQVPQFWLALVCMSLSRAAVAVSTVLNYSQLLRHVSDEFRGRVFSTLESLTWSVMMLSMMSAGIASEHHDPRLIGLWSGILSSTTAIVGAWLDWNGRLPEPGLRNPRDDEEFEIYGQATR